MFENGDFLKLLLDQFRIYGSGGIVAFQKTYESISTSMYYGGNMFRFILAVDVKKHMKKRRVLDILKKIGVQ